MIKYCVYGLCKNNSHQQGSLIKKDVWFVPFPNPLSQLEKCQTWMKACGRADFKKEDIKSNTYICSIHFVGENGPTINHPDPIPAASPRSEMELLNLKNRKRKAPESNHTADQEFEENVSASHKQACHMPYRLEKPITTQKGKIQEDLFIILLFMIMRIKLDRTIGNLNGIITLIYCLKLLRSLNNCAKTWDRKDNFCTLKTPANARIKEFEHKYHQKLSDILRNGFYYEFWRMYHVYPGGFGRFYDALTTGNLALNDQMMFEICRISSFANAPTFEFPSITLAKEGFYYDQNRQTCICAFCHKDYSNWRSGDNIEEIHRRLDPNCPYLNNRILPLNVPVFNRYTGNTGLSNRSQLSFHRQGRNFPFARIQPPEAMFPEYSSAESRLISFPVWPSTRPSAECLAKAGFFYAGKNDYVRCAYCGIVTTGWTFTDNPMFIHADLAPSCVFFHLQERIFFELVQCLNLRHSVRVIVNLSRHPGRRDETESSGVSLVLSSVQPTTESVEPITSDRTQTQQLRAPIEPNISDRTQIQHLRAHIEPNVSDRTQTQHLRAPIEPNISHMTQTQSNPASNQLPDSSDITHPINSGRLDTTPSERHDTSLQPSSRSDLHSLDITDETESSGVSLVLSSQQPMTASVEPITPDRTQTQHLRAPIETNISDRTQIQHLRAPIGPNVSDRTQTQHLRAPIEPNISDMTQTQPNPASNQLPDSSDMTNPTNNGRFITTSERNDTSKLLSTSSGSLDITGENDHVPRYCLGLKPKLLATIDPSIKHTSKTDKMSRIATFEGWRSDTGQTPELLAEAGFFFTGERDIVRCFCCDLQLKDWHSTDDPWIAHARHSPKCSHLKNKKGESYIEQVQSHWKKSGPRLTDANGFQSTFDNTTNNQASLMNKSMNSQITHDGTFGLNQSEFKYPQYDSKSARLKTFGNWKFEHKQKADSLADTGYFYTGEKDIIRCFCCDLGLAEWDAKDDPWIEHARHNPECLYLKQQKGHSYIEKVQRDWKKICSPKHAAFDDKMSRIASFDGWRSDIEQTPEILAEAGFFFTGEEDLVRCHYCDGGLRYWESGDIPWEEHAKWFPFCKFVIKMKGREFIDEMKKKREGMERGQTMENGSSTRLTETISALGESPPERGEDAVRSHYCDGGLRHWESGDVPWEDHAKWFPYRKLVIKMNGKEFIEEVKAMERGQIIENGSSTDLTETSSALGESPPGRDIKTLLDTNCKLKERLKCIRCRKNDTCMLFLNCGHRVTCESCAERMDFCPVCEKRIKKRLKTFLS